MGTIREPAVAGMFYPASPLKLMEEINLLLDSAIPPETYNNILGIVSPHAGYIYSGKTAAYAFNTLRRKGFETAVIISPSHREYFPGCCIYNGDAYRTPLGEVPINKEMRKVLTSDTKNIFEGLNGHKAEHAVEVQIPFLQMVLKDFSIVPIVIGDQSRLFINELTEKLGGVVNEKTVIIASSDLSHFYTKAEADKLDSIIEKHLNEFDYNSLESDLENEKCEACGGGAIVALLKTAGLLQINKLKILSRSNSGDVTGDISEVVGYLSAVVYN